MGSLYALRHGLVLGSAVVIGLSDDAAGFQFTVGSTINVGPITGPR